MSSWFLTRFGINHAVWPQKIEASNCGYIENVDGMYFVARTKALISYAVTTQLLILAVVLAYDKEQCLS